MNSKDTNRLTVIILTLNEECHIDRCIRSILPAAEKILVVDSGSTDSTVAIAQALGAEVVFNPFVNQAQQFNWALDQVKPDCDWIFRLDADEVVSHDLLHELSCRLPRVSPEVMALSVPRRMTFLRSPIRFGGLFPVQIVRAFRFGHGKSEDRWMDEHIVVEGKVEQLTGELLDDSLKPLGSWIDKHNNYAAREALAVLIEEMSAGPEHVANISGQAGLKRLLKQGVYQRSPAGARAFFYFLYRYIIRLGFLDGFPGLAFHVLQGFWYRFLVDARLYEARSDLNANGGDLRRTARAVLGIELPD